MLPQQLCCILFSTASDFWPCSCPCEILYATSFYYFLGHTILWCMGVKRGVFVLLYKCFDLATILIPLINFHDQFIKNMSHFSNINAVFLYQQHSSVRISPHSNSTIYTRDHFIKLSIFLYSTSQIKLYLLHYRQIHKSILIIVHLTSTSNV